MDKANDSYSGFLHEDLHEQLKLIMEALKALKHVPAELKRINAKLDRMNARQDLSDLLIRDISKTVNNHERRITHLETS